MFRARETIRRVTCWMRWRKSARTWRCCEAGGSGLRVLWSILSAQDQVLVYTPNLTGTLRFCGSFQVLSANPAKDHFQLTLQEGFSRPT